MPISEQLRNAIRDSGLSLNHITRATGIANPILSRFMSGDPDKNDIRLQRTADKLAEFFGLILIAKPGAASPPSDKKKSAGAQAAAAKSAGKSSSAAGTPARPTKSRRKSSSRSRSPGRSRGTTRKLTREQMDAEIARVEWENGKGKGRLRIAGPGTD